VSIVCICRVDVSGVFMSLLRICASLIQTYACISLFFNLRWRMYALRNIYIMMMHFFLGVNFYNTFSFLHCQLFQNLAMINQM